jgi:hypothetical protein
MLERLKAFSSYAWMPILAVGIISALLSCRNLSLQQAGNRPEMTFKRVELHDPYGAGVLSLWMQNVGTRAAFDYLLNIKTIDMGSGRVAHLENAGDSNPVKRQEDFSVDVTVDMSQFFDGLALCATFRDDGGEQFSDPVFYAFPDMPRGDEKDKAKGHIYPARTVDSDVRKKLDKMDVCKA